MTASLPVGARDIRVAAAGMLGVALVLPAVPGDVGLPCPLRAVTGVPCPFCGMTTSVTETVRMDIPSALAANPAGVLLVVLAVVVLVWRPAEIRYSLPVLGVGLASMWVFELFRFNLI